MSIGIYALYWEEPDMVYIGQSRNLEQRYKRHLSDLHANKHTNLDMQSVYNTYGLPMYVVLHECSTTELESYERMFIMEFNSSVVGLNKTHGSGSIGGPEHASAKYTKIQVLRVFILLAKSNLPYSKIAKKAKVHKSLVTTIATRAGHSWLYERWPHIYDRIKSRTVDVYCKKYAFTDPDGVIYTDLSIPEFVSANIAKFNGRQYRVICNGFYKLIARTRSSYLGWILV